MPLRHSNKELGNLSKGYLNTSILQHHQLITKTTIHIANMKTQDGLYSMDMLAKEIIYETKVSKKKAKDLHHSTQDGPQTIYLFFLHFFSL